MWTTKAVCEEIVDLGYSVKFVRYGGEPRVIVWMKASAEEDGQLVPVADFLLEEFGSYNVDYKAFWEGLDTVEQVRLSSVVVQYAMTAVSERG